MSSYMFTPDTNAVNAPIFSEFYPLLNEYLLNKGTKQVSRNGDTMEILDFKTQVNPLYRCVGGYKRNINVFFLLAESLWIWAGRKDVKFLTIFNERMIDFSDDGKVFHSPYGWRLRNYGIPSESDDKTNLQVGMDQIEKAIFLLKENPENRQVVLGLWNPELDMTDLKTKDRPCNDLLMYKIRDGKLHGTISNRSNDLHWGLPTNIFQFSFVGEFIASILGISYSCQVHNSQSLHIYTNNEIAGIMEREYDKCYRPVGPREDKNLYRYCSPTKMIFNWGSEDVGERLKELDKWVKFIIDNLGGDLNFQFELIQKDTLHNLHLFSPSLSYIYELLARYINYKNMLKACNTKEKKEEVRKFVITNMTKLEGFHDDFHMLALNFFHARTEEESTTLGNL